MVVKSIEHNISNVYETRRLLLNLVSESQLDIAMTCQSSGDPKLSTASKADQQSSKFAFSYFLKTVSLFYIVRSCFKMILLDCSSFFISFTEEILEYEIKKYVVINNSRSGKYGDCI